MLERKEVVFLECRSTPVRQDMDTESTSDLNPIPQKEECYEDQEVASGQPSLVASG